MEHRETRSSTAHSFGAGWVGDGSHLPTRGRGLPGRGPGLARGQPARRLVRPGLRAPSEAARERFNEEWTQKLFEGGWICASWPKEYGGKGLSIIEAVVVNEEFARANAPMRADFFGDTLVGPTILQWGTEEQKREFLPGDPAGPRSAGARGSPSPTPAPTWPSLKTRAVLDGDEWVINGQKIWTTQAQYADYIFLLARTDPDAPEARGHQLPARADEAARHRGPTHRPARRLGRVQRGVLHRRPLPGGQRRRRRQQRLEGGDDHARLRAGNARPPPATAASRRSSTRSSRSPGPTGPSTTQRSASASSASGRRSRSCGSTACAP